MKMDISITIKTLTEKISVLEKEVAEKQFEIRGAKAQRKKLSKLEKQVEEALNPPDTKEEKEN
jgi:hypothetical protein